LVEAAAAIEAAAGGGVRPAERAAPQAVPAAVPETAPEAAADDAGEGDVAAAGRTAD